MLATDSNPYILVTMSSILLWLRDYTSLNFNTFLFGWLLTLISLRAIIIERSFFCSHSFAGGYINFFLPFFFLWKKKKNSLCCIASAVLDYFGFGLFAALWIFNLVVASFFLSATSFASALSVAIRLCWFICYDALIFIFPFFAFRGSSPCVCCLLRFEMQGYSFPLQVS